VAAWAKCGRPMAEFWAASPAQADLIFRANGMKAARKGTLADLAATARTAGVPVERAKAGD
jgi:hypothetical protein